MLLVATIPIWLAIGFGRMGRAARKWALGLTLAGGAIYWLTRPEMLRIYARMAGQRPSPTQGLDRPGRGLRRGVLFLPPALCRRRDPRHCAQKTGRAVRLRAAETDGVNEAAREAHAKGYTHLYVIGFAIQSNARKLVGSSEDVVGVTATYIQATPDLTMGDLLNNMRSSQIFSVCGMPEIEIRPFSRDPKGSAAPRRHRQCRPTSVPRDSNARGQSVVATAPHCAVFETEVDRRP